ncbi:MAG: DUF370 domain-containing protein [Bacillota bacterium]|nr:DUF370 domain-containing protein [Bacillota bacterium]
MLKIGQGNSVNNRHIISIVQAGNAPAKRMVNNARESGSLVDATAGRKTRSVIVMNSQHIVISSAAPEKLIERMEELR